MGVEDIPAILELENACWLPELRASEKTLRTRFGMGHISLGMFVNAQLVGSFSFSYSRFSPNIPDELPDTFKGFSGRPRDNNYNTAFAYNFNIHPRARGGTLTRELLWAGLNRMREDGCQYLLAAVRCPSYNGSLGADVEAIQPSPGFKKTVATSIQTGKLSATRDLIVDPLLRFYQRTLDCVFLKVVPDFLPDDAPSGGFGVIFYKEL
jgi:hypothetical protein